MEDKTEEIVKQYPIHVNGKRRIRGGDGTFRQRQDHTDPLPGK